MADLPKSFQAGGSLLEQLTATRLNQLLAAIRQATPLPGRGTTTRVTGNGTCVDLSESLNKNRAFTTIHPFQITVASGENPASHYVRVRYGTVNNTIPTGMQLGDSPPYILEIARSNGFIVVGIIYETDATNETFLDIISAWIEVVGATPENAPDVEEEEGKAYYALGSFSIVDGHINIAQNVTTSLGWTRAGFVNVWGAA